MTSTGAVAVADAQQVIDLANDDYADATLFVARTLGGFPEAASAVMASLDAVGIRLVVDGEHDVRCTFDAPLTQPGTAMRAFFGLVARARSSSGQPGTTSAERVAAQLAGVRTWLTTVADVEDVNPALRRITVAGGDLDAFTPIGPDTFVYVLAPPPGRDTLAIDRSFTWDAYRRLPDEDRPVGAYYTVRRWDPSSARLEMLFVLHGDSGPASAWARRAAPGDPVALWGPRSSFAPPTATTSHLLVADETGLPAAAAIIEAIEPGTPVRVLAEVGDRHTRQDLPEQDGVEITWLHRAGLAAGTTTLLVDTVRTLPALDAVTYAWGGAEARTMTAVRRHLRDVVGLRREQVAMVGYWRRDDDHA